MRTTRIRTTVIGCAAALLAAFTAAGPAQAAGAPTGAYTGMGACPLSNPLMTDPNNGSVGCFVSTIGGGYFNVGSNHIPLTGAVSANFGTYWSEVTAPVASFPDGSIDNIYSTLGPTYGSELSAPLLNVPLPLLPNFFPGVTGALVQIELAGPIQNFTPLSLGENYPMFELPVKMHVLNAFLGLDCYIGSNSNPIMLSPTAGTTAPPAPNKPITGNPGTLSVSLDPNHNDLIATLTGATLVDNSFSVPGANGCGILGSLDWAVNAIFGLGSSAGHNTAVLSGVNATFAIDSTAADLQAAITASEG